MDYILCGWRVRSELELPHLACWSGDDEAAPDITISLGAVDPVLPDPVRLTPFLQIGRDGTGLVILEQVARYRVEQGRRVTVEPVAGVAAGEIRLFLFGTVLGLLCHQRGVLPLHASAVAINGRVLALAGEAGAGKSTLASALVRRGHRLVTDDICVIPPGPGPVVVWPFAPAVKLWRDSVTALGLAPGDLVRNRAGQEKFQLSAAEAEASTTPLPLSRVLILAEDGAISAPWIDRIQGFRAFTALLNHVYRRRAALELGRNGGLQQDVARIARQVRIGRLVRHKRYGDLEAQTRFLEQMMEQDG